MTAARAFITVALATLVFGICAGLIFRTPPTVYTGVTRLAKAPFAPNIIAVRNGSPAFGAGLRTGDTVSCLSIRDKELLFPRFGFSAYAPDMVIRGCVLHGAAWHRFAFAPASAPPIGFLYFNVLGTIVRLAVCAIFLLTGVALVLARPTLLTGLFYTYCLSSAPFFVFTSLGTLWPEWVYDTLLPFSTGATAIGVVSLALFALCVPNDGIPPGWRRATFIAVTIAGILPLANSLVYAGLTSANVPLRFFVSMDEVFTTAAVVIVFVRLLEVRGEERARLGWVAFALTWGVVTNAMRNNVGTPDTLWFTLSTLAADATVLMPLVMIYAVLKRHIIDVRFVISRTVVYATLTTFVVAIIGLVDWLTSAYLSQVRFAMAIDAAVTIALAFVLHRAYAWIENAVDFMLFRQKHEAERYLERASRSLMFAEHEDSVDRTLVHDPFDKLQLNAAALYRPRDGRYVPVRIEGWPEAAAPRFRSDDDLIRFMLAERSKISVSELRTHVAEPFRLHGHMPTVAIPVFQGNRLTAFALYGTHRDGTQLDPDEIATLERLCGAAAQAYTGIELERYQRSNAAMTAVLT